MPEIGRKPYMAMLCRFAGLPYASTLTDVGWRELADVLREESDGVIHAEKIVDEFLRTPRRDEDGQLLAAIPAPIELRMFARGIASGSPTATACPCCSSYAGAHCFREMCGGTPRDTPVRCLCARGRQLRAMDLAREK